MNAFSPRKVLAVTLACSNTYNLVTIALAMVLVLLQFSFVSQSNVNECSIFLSHGIIENSP